MIEEERKMIVTDSEGNQKEMEIMFTFDHNDKKFVVYFDPTAGENDLNTFASLYDEDGNLYPIEDDEDWDVVEEMINTFTDGDFEDEEN